jgi:hypothetical protein
MLGLIAVVGIALGFTAAYIARREAPSPPASAAPRN